MPWLPILGVVLTLVVAAYTAHRVLTWMNKKGWVYYRNPERPPPKSLGILEELYQPSIAHVIDEETREASEADQIESGEPESPGRSAPESEEGHPPSGERPSS